ncbi:MAG: hypothetical protein ACH34X_19370 [Thiolinea sp.]
MSYYLEKLESHGVILEGSEAAHYLATAQNPTFKQHEDQLIEALGGKLANKSIDPLSYENLEISSFSTHGALTLNTNNSKFRFKLIPQVTEGFREKTWYLNLSDLSFDELGLNTMDACQFNLAIKQNKQEQSIPLFNTPYLLSAASLTQQQRLQLFAHLEIKLIIRIYLDTGTVTVSLYGDDGKQTQFQFAGYLPAYQESMLSAWYTRLVPSLCINEPPEVKGLYGT